MADLLPVPLDPGTLPLPLSDALTSARDSGDMTALRALTRGVSTPAEQALEAWALASIAKRGVYIDDVPRDTARAKQLWDAAAPDLPNTKDHKAFSTALRALVKSARDLAQHMGVPMPKLPPLGAKLSSKDWAKQAKGLDPAGAAEAWRKAAEAARGEGADARPYDRQATLSAASAQIWADAEPGLRAMLFDSDVPGGKAGADMRSRAAWFLLRIATQRQDQTLLREVWSFATTHLPDFPHMSVILCEVMGFAMTRRSDDIGRALWAVIQDDLKAGGKNRHIYALVQPQLGIFEAAQKRYRKRFLGLF